MIEQLVARVFALRDAAHLRHWKTDSLSQHEALGELYTNLIDLIDKIVETHQGARGLINEIPAVQRPRGDMLTASLEADAMWIREHRSKIASGIPAIENLLDELCGEMHRTLYKLRHLK
jgi:DNA-binding ferritin-like protein